MHCRRVCDIWEIETISKRLANIGSPIRYKLGITFEHHANYKLSHLGIISERYKQVEKVAKTGISNLIGHMR